MNDVSPPMSRAGRGNSRAVSARIVERWLRGGEFPDRLVDDISADRAVVTEVVFGSVKSKRALEWAIRKLASGSAEPAAVPYLFVGLYQVLFMTGVEDYAAVNETVEASKSSLSRTGAGFVNAVLRRAVAEKQGILTGLRKQHLGIRESHPDVLVDRWRSRMGSGATTKLCKWNNGRPDVIVCLNLLKTGPERFAADLQACGIAAQRHPFAPDRCFALPRGTRVSAVPGYPDGDFSVQDAAMPGIVKMLGAQPGDAVLDACAAPGGKAVLIAEALAGEGRLVAMDLREDRIETLRANLARMGFRDVVTAVGDAATPGGTLKDMRFDRILCDAPCTNTGVLRRRPDARWRFSVERMRGMQRVQRGILDGVVPFLKPGGALVYSVCSIEPEEGSDLIADWLLTHRDFRLDDTISTFPPETGADGIFAARLRKSRPR